MNHNMSCIMPYYSIKTIVYVGLFGLGFGITYILCSVREAIHVRARSSDWYKKAQGDKGSWPGLLARMAETSTPCVGR